MTSNVSSAVTSRYAKALLDLAEEKKVLKKVEADILDLVQTLDGSEELRDVFQDPRSDKDALFNVVEQIAKKAKLQDLTANFLNVLVENGRIAVVSNILKAVGNEAAKRRGEKVASVKVAQDLTAAQKKAIEKQLSETSGAKVTLDVQVDPSILGGMIVTLDSKMIDDSVARKLERLKIRMGSGSNENKIQTLSEVV